MFQIGTDMDRLDQRRFLVSEAEHRILAKSQISDILKRIRKIKGRQLLAFKERHVLDAPQGIRQDHSLYGRARKRAVPDRLGSILHRVLSAPRSGILDQCFSVLRVQDAVHCLVSGIISADPYFRKVLALREWIGTDNRH